MVHKVEKFIAKHHLLQTGDKVLVALSGGADSVALLVVLNKLGYRCEAIHCNFHLRGEESNSDENFVRTLCSRLNIKVDIVHFNTAEYAAENGVSIEMAAREQRYKAFEERLLATQAAAIAVAHHRDDSAETLLLNLVRGTGIKGLRGIQPRNGHVIRPLLCVGRTDIIDYLRWRGEEYVTDSTNLIPDYTRNKIRLEIIPKLAEINPSILDSLATTASNLSDAEKIYHKAIEESVSRVKNGNIIDIPQLKQEIAPATLLHEILSPLGFNSTQTNDIAAAMNSDSGKTFSSNSYTIIKNRDTFIITANSHTKAKESIPLPIEGEVIFPGGRLRTTRHPYDGHIPKEQHIAMLDANLIQHPLLVRSTQPGDRFAPFGMRGTKLVSDYLTDKKKNILEKQQQLVVTDATGKIAWLVGLRPAAPFCVSKETKECIIIEWIAN